MDLTQRARNVFCKDLYATQLTGVVIEHVEPERTCCTLTLTASHRNAKGAVMGGVLFTLADLAFAVAAHTPLLEQMTDGAPLQLCWVSASSNIHFVNAVRGDTLTASTRCIRQGRTQALFQITVTDNTDRTVALITTAGVRVES